MIGKLFIGALAVIGLAISVIHPVFGQEQDAVGEAGIQIENAVMCRNVVDRVPIGTGDVFSKEIEEVYCFFKVVGAADPTQITVNWYYQGSLKSSLKLPVNSAGWRTWSSKSISPEWTGEWMVEILAEDGAPLENIIFFVE